MPTVATVLRKADARRLCLVAASDLLSEADPPVCNRILHISVSNSVKRDDYEE